MGKKTHVTAVYPLTQTPRFRSSDFQSLYDISLCMGIKPTLRYLTLVSFNTYITKGIHSFRFCNNGSTKKERLSAADFGGVSLMLYSQEFGDYLDGTGLPSSKVKVYRWGSFWMIFSTRKSKTMMEWDSYYGCLDTGKARVRALETSNERMAASTSLPFHYLHVMGVAFRGWNPSLRNQLDSPTSLSSSASRTRIFEYDKVRF